MKTAVQQIIEKFEYIKENHCKSLQEVVFFDGILAVLESGEYKAIEKEQAVEFAYEVADDLAYGVYSKKAIEDMFNEHFKSE
jgi:hypothetical protein